MSEPGVSENPTTRVEYQTPVPILEKPMLKICTELKPKLEEGEYGIVVGDDTSARLPTLVVRGFAGFVSEKKGIRKPSTVFLQAGNKVTDEDLASQFEDRIVSQSKGIEGKKALIITEYIFRGNVLKRLTGMFKAHALPFDVVALRIFDDFDPTKLALPESSLLIIGDISSHGPSIWNRPDLTGLNRVSNSTDKVTVIKGNSYTRRRVEQARADVDLLVKEIIKQTHPIT